MKKVKSRRAPATATRKPEVAVERTGKADGKRRVTVAKPASKARRAAEPVRTKARLAKPTKPTRRAIAKPVRGGAKDGVARKGTKVLAPAKPELQIRELDPLRVCGERTSVVQLFRVDEQLVEGKVAGARQVHLVFNDRHGWYCEHGRSCHAVSAVMRHAGIR